MSQPWSRAVEASDGAAWCAFDPVNQVVADSLLGKQKRTETTVTELI